MLVAYSILAIASLSVAQDLGVPLSWRKFSNTRPKSERITISANALNSILGQLNTGTAEFNGIGFWQSGNVFSVLANHDRLAGVTTYRDRTLNGLNTAFRLNANYDRFQFNDDAMWWALSSIYAYQAYGDTNQLNHAIAVWNRVAGYVVTTAQASSGTNPNKAFPLAKSCDGKTMAGGVFWRPTATDQAINSITTTLYITLSAYLASITRDSKYTNAAILSANWIRNLNTRSDGIILDSVDGRTCARSPDTWIFTYNSGKFIEGLMILFGVTGDTTWRDLASRTVAVATKGGPWQGSDGIITEGSNTSSNDDGVGFKAILIRALAVVYEKSDNNALKTLVHSYGDVQYNALLDLAANGSTYSANWRGPPQGFTTWGQLAAIDVMTSNILTN